MMLICSFDAVDACDPDPPVYDVPVTSDEHPAGPGRRTHCPDAVIAGDQSVSLRAERLGPGDGRVYQVSVSATDACGNASSCSAEITVPHSSGRGGEAVDSGQAFDATVCD